MTLSNSKQTILLLFTIVLAYAWISVPFLAQYSLQIFALTIISYFLLKRYHKAKAWHIAPAYMSAEIILASFAFLMLIGATGNKDSVFYPLTYVHLFFLVFATRPSTSILVTGGLIWFHYALGIEITPTEIADLLTLPLILSFFLFTKHQYQDSLSKTVKLEEEKQLINKENQEISSFFNDYLQPKLNQLRQNMSSKDQFASEQIKQINDEIDNLEKHIDQYINQQSETDESQT